MRKILGLLLWTFVFFIVLVTIDQVMLRVPLNVAGWREIRTFYVDFRGRLLHLELPGGNSPAKPVKTVKGEKATVKLNERRLGKTTTKPPASPEESPQFVFTDAAGNLQFATTLEEVPAEFRDEAKRLAP